MEGEKWPPLHTRRGVQYSDISGTGLMPCPVKFSTSSPGADRIHYVNEDDIRIVLSRLPDELWDRLRTVHFNDRSRGARVLGYVNRGRRDIALCALPPRMSLIQALRNGQRPEEFGARRGEKWPRLAIRRFMLYDVFLHELGHLQLIDEDAVPSGASSRTKRVLRSSRCTGATSYGRRHSPIPIGFTIRPPQVSARGSPRLK
jgi:hypothetical protein